MSPKRTPLFASHRAAGARLVDFAGWEMPVHYEGILAEHAMVRQRAGLFDVSHMGQIEVRGGEAAARLQWLTANDIHRLADGQAQYSLLLLEDGGIADDVIIHRHDCERFMVCVNAANRDTDAAYLREHCRGVEVVDRSDETALLALQGPQATALAATLTAVDLDAIESFRFVHAELAGCPCMLARTGYTGEDGWEIYTAAVQGTRLWNAILEAGRRFGVGPAGLGARDTLRLEAALPLYGHELDRSTKPHEARLGWVVRALDECIAAVALRQEKERGLQRKLVGVEVPRGGIPRQNYPLLRGGRRVGEVTSGTRSPSLGKGIALGYVEPESGRLGTELAVEIRGRAIDARVVRLPFYRRSAR